MTENNHPYEFFSQEDISFYTKLRKDKRPVRSLQATEIKWLKHLFDKTNYWAHQVADNVLSVKEDNRWQNSGWVKKYSWARVFDKQDKDKLIYFTLGFDDWGRLIYKLDCQRGQKMAKHLSPAQVKKFDFMLKDTGASWNEIVFDALPNYKWETLITLTKSFIDQHLPLYREVIDYVWNEEEKPILENKLNFSFEEKPDLPEAFRERLPYFLSKNIPQKINFEKQNQVSKKTGDLGEQFILAIEKQQLLDWDLKDLVPQKMRDGVGYDIESYDKNEVKKFIEVKTTLGGKKTPIYISQNEVEFLKRTPNSFIYRVYNFKPIEKKGQIFILTYADLEKLNMLPKEYKVYFD